ncbi:MAG: hypothetical protein DME80_04335 [Verrucomicrobia bacterium]|nr:MAG: hypothetical protein DME80_04335 [Verrucomicrobiota bacterium]
MALPQPAAPVSQDRARIVFDCRMTSGHYIVGDFAPVYEINHGPHAQKLTRKGLAGSLEISSAVIFPEPARISITAETIFPVMLHGRFTQ